MLAHLPPELFDIVIQVGNLCKEDISALSKVSRVFRDGAQRALFRTSGPTAFPVGLVGGSMRTEAFFDAIISSPHRLAPMVHTYTEYTEMYIYDDDEYSVEGVEQWKMVERMSKALHLVTNLRSFQSTDGALNGYLVDDILELLMDAFPSLEELHWDYQRAEQKLVDFLAKHPGIRRLELPNVFSLEGYTSTERDELLLAARHVCPKLEALSAPLSTTQILLPGKSNIRYLHLTEDMRGTEWSEESDSEDPLREVDAGPMLEQLSRIQYVRIYENKYRPLSVPFRKIAASLNDVVFMKVYNKRVIEEDPTIFAHLHYLRAVECFDESYYATEPIPHSNLRTLFAQCKRLQYVDYERREAQPQDERSRAMGIPATYNLTRRRFTRGVLEGETLSETPLDCGELIIDHPELKWDNIDSLVSSLTRDKSM